MSIDAAYGFINTNRRYTEEEIKNTLTYKQLEQFLVPIVIDVHWHPEKRKELDRLIDEMDDRSYLYMYSIDTLLKGKNNGIDYYKRILEKGINLLILDQSSSFLKTSPFSTFGLEYFEEYLDEERNREKESELIEFGEDYKLERETGKSHSKDEKRNMEKVSKLIEFAKDYKPEKETGKSHSKAEITEDFVKLYFEYESYRITEKILLSRLPSIGIQNKQTFMALCREYEKHLLYSTHVDEYSYVDSKFLKLPKRTGKIPSEMEEILRLSNFHKSGDDLDDRIDKVLRQKRIHGYSGIIKRWALAMRKVPKPRKPDNREVEDIGFQLTREYKIST